MGAGSTGDEDSSEDEAEDGPTGSEADAGGASGVRHKRRRRRRRPPCFHAKPPGGDYHPGCKSCVKADWCKPPEIDTYAGGKIQLLGTPGANATMKGYLDDLAKTPTGGKVLGIIKELATGGPVRILHVDPATLKKFMPRELPAKPEDIGKVVGDLAWTMANDSTLGSAQSWHVESDLGPTGDGKTLLPSPVVPGSKASSGSLIVYWEINVLSDIYHMPPPDNPGSVWIGHELVHVVHALRGEMLNRYGANDPYLDPYNNEEETRTIGTTWWFKEELSENAIRRDLGLNTRVSHGGFVDSSARGNNRPVE
jgi:hypothetical protein